MKFLKKFFQFLSIGSSKKDLRKLFAPFASNKAASQQQPTARTNTESGELTQDQLAEALSWLSLY